MCLSKIKVECLVPMNRIKAAVVQWLRTPNIFRQMCKSTSFLYISLYSLQQYEHTLQPCRIDHVINCQNLLVHKTEQKNNT